MKVESWKQFVEECDKYPHKDGWLPLVDVQQETATVGIVFYREIAGQEEFYPVHMSLTTLQRERPDIGYLFGHLAEIFYWSMMTTLLPVKKE